MQYLYKESDRYYFMNMETFDQLEFDKNSLGEDVKFLKENLNVSISFYESEVLGIIFPDKIVMTVTKTEPGVKGNTANNAMKEATLETGLVVKVPLFINEGEQVIVSTKDGKYDSRV